MLANLVSSSLSNGIGGIGATVSVFAMGALWKVVRSRRKERLAHLGQLVGALDDIKGIKEAAEKTDKKVAELEIGHQELQEAIQTLRPNGGNTNETGDLVLKIARRMGVVEGE